MIRETSLEAYRKIKENGFLSRRRFEVYEFVALNGPCTINTILKKLSVQGNNTSSYTSRLGELRDMGVLQEVGKEIAPTQNSVILWDITERMPVKLVKKETKSQAIKRLEKQVAELIDELNCHSLR